MKPELRAVLSERLGSQILRLEPVAGGDICEAYRAELAEGTQVFVKTRADAPSEMFTSEARGLRWLAEAQALRIPRVLAVATPGEQPFLALELICSAPRAQDFDERLGRGLAELHRYGAPSFGFASDNFIGSLPQSNRAAPTWAEFYAEQRLLPQLRRARDARHLQKSLSQRFDQLLARLPELVGPVEPPARLHGDLWGGNLLADELGRPCLIDPAVYGGQREMDWAMLRLFGGAPTRALAAYHEAYALAPGADARVALYQLYPLLVHVNLFGASYVGALERALSAYA